MAKKKKAADEETTEKRTPKPRGRKGETWGLSVCATWFKVMKRNYREKLTDKEIAEFMQAEFPKCKKYTESDVAMHRTLFNKGKLKTNLGETPEKPLTGYNEEGEKIERKRRAPGKKAKKEDVAEQVNLDDDDDDDDPDDDEDSEPPKSRRRRKKKGD